MEVDAENVILLIAKEREEKVLSSSKSRSFAGAVKQAILLLFSRKSINVIHRLFINKSEELVDEGQVTDDDLECTSIQICDWLKRLLKRDSEVIFVDPKKWKTEEEDT